VRIEAGTSMPIRRGILRDVRSTPKADSQPESPNVRFGSLAEMAASIFDVRFSNRPFGVKRKPALGPIGDYFDDFHRLSFSQNPPVFSIFGAPPRRVRPYMGR
jgi:hypothetical protein